MVLFQVLLFRTCYLHEQLTMMCKHVEGRVVLTMLEHCHRGEASCLWYPGKVSDGLCALVEGH